MSADSISSDLKPAVIVDTSKEPVAPGKFAPTWESLKQYETPEWFRDAKFGIWAHWGPQCQPEYGDWYARAIYSQNNNQYLYHVDKYGHPSKFGFKDVINDWKAQNWDPQKLVALYKKAGAQYFFAMANHHDNLDMWDSTYQSWNSTVVGPKRNIVAEWASAARENGLKFGLSVHASHAWSWYEPAQSADKNGPLAGVPYDGKLTKADGKGTWWEGLDPQELYEQDHTPSPDYGNLGSIHGRWNWGNGVSQPDQAYCDKFYNRTVELINKFNPDLLYFDDTALPLWPASDAGLKIAAHYYNHNIAANNGKLQAVLFGKILSKDQQQCMTWDIERGQSHQIEPYPWQTDTCIGGWHYERSIYYRKGYKSAQTVIHNLADIVSKNGCLLLNIPVRGDGTIDQQEVEIVEGIGAWMKINSESIFGTRPWKVFGEGPASASAAPLTGQGFNEGKVKFTAEDVRFTSKGNAIYAIVLGKPEKPLAIKSLGEAAGLLNKTIIDINLIGSTQKVSWTISKVALTINPIKDANANDIAYVFKIVLQ